MKPRRAAGCPAAWALVAALATAVVLAHCTRELSPTGGEGGLDLRWSWSAGGGAAVAADTARLWVLDAGGGVLVGPVAAGVGPDGSVEFTLRVPAGENRSLRLLFEARGSRGRGVVAAGTASGIDVPRGGTADAQVHLVPVVPRLLPIEAEPGALAFEVRWTRVPTALGYELFIRDLAGESTQALTDTIYRVPLASPLAALDTTFYRVRAELPWGGWSVTSDSSRVSIPALNDLPRIAAVDPPSGAIGVPDSSEITLRFDRAIDPSSVGDLSVPSTDNSVTLRDEPEGPLVSLLHTWGQQGMELRLRPAAPLRRDGAYRLRVRPVLRDLEGRPLDQEPALAGLQGLESDFTTERYNPLRVVSVTPADGASGVPLRSRVEARLNRGARSASVNPQTVTLTDSAGVSVEVAVGLVADSVIQVVPDAPLRFGTRYALAITPGVLDLRGRPGEPLDQDPATDGLQPFTSTFRCVAQPPGPKVVAVAPSDGEANAPVGQVVRVVFSRPVQAATVPGNLTVRKLPVGAAISGVVSSDSDRRVFRFTPTGLERGQRYRVVVAAGGFDSHGDPFGVLDDQGVPFDQDSTQGGFQEFSSIFRVEENPRVLSVAPADGRIGVPVDTLIHVRFSLPVSRTSVSAGGLTLRSGEGVIPTDLPQFSTDTTEVTLRPIAPLGFYRAYAVHADTSLRSNRGSKFDQNPDLSGYQSFRSDFRTATDGIAPRVVEWLPGEGEEQVPVDTEVRVIFNRAVVPATVLDERNFLLRRLPAGIVVPARRAVDADSAGAVLTPLAPLDYQTEYEVVVTKFVEDPFGQQLDQDPAIPFNQDFSGRFRTDQERIAPLVTTVDPAPGASEVPVEAVITVRFSEPMGYAGTLEGAFALTGPDGPVAGDLALSPDAFRLIFTPAAPLRHDVRFDVRVDTTATDRTGNRLDQFPDTGVLDPFTSFFFTVPDRAAPQVTSSVPADGESAVEVTVRPRIGFGEPCLPASLLTGVRLVDSLLAAEVMIEPLPAADGRSVELAPRDSLRFDALYVLEANSSVRDTSGNGLDQDPATPGAQPFRAVFRTRLENIPPRVRTVLFDGGLPAPLLTALRVVFTEPCEAASVTSDNLRLFLLDEEVPGAVTLSAPDTALIVPADTLEYDSTYRLVVRRVRDLLGNELDQDPVAPGAQPYELAFQTEADLVPPSVRAVVPPPEAAGVTPDVTVGIRFSEPVDSNTVAAGVTLYHIDVGAQLVSGRISAEPTQVFYTFRPGAPLQDSARYLIRVDGDIRDLAGNAFDQDPGTPGTDPFTSEFRTGIRPLAVAGAGVCDPPDSTRVTFDASGSLDPDGELRQAVWDWGDGRRDTLHLPDPRWPSLVHDYACLDARGCDGFDNDGDGAADETGAEGCDESYRIILAVEDSTGIWSADTTGVAFCAFLATGSEPPDGATGVDSALVAVRVFLTRVLPPASLDPARIRLETEAGDSVAVTLSVNAGGREVALVPVDPLRRATTYRVRILPGLSTEDGRPFDQEPCLAGRQGFESRFTTESTRVRR